MALVHDKELFTKWVHVENGKVLVRRLHRIEIQAGDGRLYVLTGNKLPDSIQTNSGHGYTGVHLAQILLPPEAVRRDSSQPPSEGRFWPGGRDVLHVVLGVLIFVAIRFFADVIQQAAQ